MKSQDWNSVRAIYEEGIATGNATFEMNVPEWKVWNQDHLPDCRFVAREEGEIVGWAALSPVSGRCVYAGVAEVSVYVAASARGRGIGKALLHTLVEGSENQGIWTLQAGIFPENEASIALHRSCGFRVVGRREHPGRMMPAAKGAAGGAWRDVVLMERRSNVVGV
jgi:phosphinothricin acetyltransferase